MAAMAVNTNQSRGISPVFILCQNFPLDNNKLYTVHELCAVAEERSGFSSVPGAQPMGGVWRLYPKTEDA